MPSSPPKKGPSEKSKKDWTWSMKYALHYLDRQCNSTATQRTAVFKVIFNEEVSAWIVTDARLTYLIRTQIKEGRSQRMKQWKEIYRSAESDADIANRKSIEARIHQAILNMSQAPAVRPAPAAVSAVAIRARTVHPATDTRPMPRATSANIEPSTIRTMRCTKRVNTRDLMQAADAVPLSRRAAVGSWDPKLTDEEVESVAPAPKRRRTTAMKHPSAGLPSPQAWRIDCRRATTSTSSLTPPKRKRPTAPKVEYRQAHGKVIQWTPEKIAQAREDLPPVLEGEAHPAMNGLLFRYWNEDPNEPRNSVHGFTARKYSRARVNFNQPSPPCDQLDWEELFYHIDRSGKAIEWQSIFISTSNSLLWTLQKARKEMKHNPEMRISVIDAHALDRKSVYHVLPYHKRLKLKGEFTDGSWRYAGTHEFLVHRRVPGKAIVHTFKVQDLLNFMDHDQDAYDPVIERILRLDTLDQTRDLKTCIYPQLKEDKIPLSAVVAIGVAKLTAFAGIKSNSDAEHIQAFVAEIIQGWALQLKRQTPEQWTSLATSFANALFEYSQRPRTLKEEMLVKRAFLGGVFWGSSKHFNPRHSSKHIQSTYRSAKDIGLEDPGKLTMDEVNAMQMHLMIYEKTQQRRLPHGHKTQLLLTEDPVSDEGFASGEEDDEQGLSSTGKWTGKNSITGRRVEPEDADEDEDQDEIVVNSFVTSKHVTSARYTRVAYDIDEDDDDDSIIYE